MLTSHIRREPVIRLSVCIGSLGCVTTPTRLSNTFGAWRPSLLPFIPSSPSLSTTLAVVLKYWSGLFFLLAFCLSAGWSGKGACRGAGRWALMPWLFSRNRIAVLSCLCRAVHAARSALLYRRETKRLSGPVTPIGAAYIVGVLGSFSPGPLTNRFGDMTSKYGRRSRRRLT